MGADHVIDRSVQNVWEEVERIYPDGADVIFDANGGRSLSSGFHHLARSGRLMSYGSHTSLPKHSGRLNYLKLAKAWLTAPRFNSLNMNTRSLITFNLSFLFDRIELFKEATDDLLKWIEEGKISPLKVTTYPFEDVANAHRDLQSGNTIGKLVLIV